MKSQLRPALVVFGVLTLVTGVAYPLVVTAVGQGLFPHAANGSLVPGGGSELIGQPFDGPGYFWGRPSATSPFADNAASSTGFDPHISPAAAEYQVTRVTAARGVSADEVRKLVAAHTSGRTLGALGEPRVNVLLLNRDLDARWPVAGR
jgi:K+-transporting ATPase ATPase C chain